MPRQWTEEQKQTARDRAAQKRAEKEAQAAEMPEAQVAAEPFDPGGGQEVSEPSASPLPDDYEQRRISEEVKKKVDQLLAEKAAKEREKALKTAYDEELLRQKRLAGLIDHQDDIVEFRVNVAPFSTGLTLDGHHWPHGAWVKMTRREYDSARDIMARSWESEDRAGNPNKKHAQERALYGGLDPTLLERRMPDGTFTLGWSHEVNGRSGSVFGERR